MDSSFARAIVTRRNITLGLGAAATSLVVGELHADPAPDASSVASKSLRAYYYGGNDMVAHVSMQVVRSDGATRSRELSMLRRNVGSERQEFLMYFQAPADVKDMAYLVHKHPQRDDDRWLYMPSLKLVKRIAARDKHSSFAGSDFTYEDSVGRDISDESYKFKKEATIAGRNCVVIEASAKEPVSYAKRVAWVDAERWLPLQEEYYDTRGELVRTFSAVEVEQIGGVWTIKRSTMKNAKSGQKTLVQMRDVAYNVGLDGDLFTNDALRAPPRKWLR
ncbi:MAG: outer membrane lipoprotein-sorting protein [Myxococcota bacterium]